MKLYRAGLAIFAAVAFVSGCQRRDEITEAEAAELASREQRLAARLAGALTDTTGEGILARWVLPIELKEISGLAVTANGNLLAHNDEQGRVFAIDPKRGVVLKQFMVGNGDLRGDFEGIAVHRGEIFMLVSNGTVYRFREGADGESVAYTVVDTRLGRECEFEGIAVDASGRMLLPCKNVAKRGPKGQLVIYQWDLSRARDQRPTMLTVPLDDLIGPNGWKSLHPSDVTIDPASGNYVLIAAQEKALVEITPGGQVVRSGPLPEPSEQAEGVAILKEGILAISDEGNRNVATITLYRWPLPAAAAKVSVMAMPGESATTVAEERR